MKNLSTYVAAAFMIAGPILMVAAVVWWFYSDHEIPVAVKLGVSGALFLFAGVMTYASTEDKK